MTQTDRRIEIVERVLIAIALAALVGILIAFVVRTQQDVKVIHKDGVTYSYPVSNIRR